MKPATPILRNEHYLDVMTGGSASLPSPILREERYLAKLAGMDVSIPSPVTIKEKYYAKICGMDVDVPAYTRNMPRIYAYMAKAAGQTIDDLPTAVTREQRYWYDYVSEQPVTEHEYTGVVPYTFSANGEPLVSWRISGNTVQSTTPTPQNPVMPQGTGERTGNLFDYKTAYALYINADGDIAATMVALGTVHNSLADFVGQTVTIRVYCKTVTATRVYVQAKIGSTQKSSNNIYQGDTGYMALTVTPETTDDYWLISYGSQGTGNNVYSKLMLNTGSTALPYEPYGYKIPIICGDTTTTVYIGANPLRKSLDGTAVDELSSNGTLTQRVDTDGSVLPTPIVSQITTPTIPTNNGNTTIDVETAVKPSEVYIKWKG